MLPEEYVQENIVSENFKARNILLPQLDIGLNSKLCLSSVIERVAFSVLN